MAWMKTAWEWAKGHAVALLLALGAILGGVLYILSKNNDGANIPLGDAIALRRATQEVATKEAQAAALVQQGDAGAERAAQLQREIADSKRRAMEIHHGPVVTDMTDEQVASLFSRSNL